MPLVERDKDARKGSALGQQSAFVSDKGIAPSSTIPNGIEGERVLEEGQLQP